MKHLLLAFIFTIGSLLTLPAYAWPDVDHMNMCGSATKVVRTYGGSAQSFTQRDSYLAQRGNAYYFRTNCPTTVASAAAPKNVAPITKAKSKKVAYKTSSTASKTKNAKKTVKRLRGGYDKQADCERVDRMNNYGRPVTRLR